MTTPYPRDMVGYGGDYAMDPFTYLKWNNSTLYNVVRAGVGVYAEAGWSPDS